MVCLAFKHMARVSWTAKKLSSHKPLRIFFFNVNPELCAMNVKFYWHLLCGYGAVPVLLTSFTVKIDQWLNG